ncbi:unnamed protein product [Gulo gulo]|uniref:Uncharacterized protein n=1 Tax=Gulo gulo TaxID=48420 RepID=A0A9X9QBI4_GULGU|nr:unnamed protein product [Gulo gulo]
MCRCFVTFLMLRPQHLCHHTSTTGEYSKNKLQPCSWASLWSSPLASLVI